MYKVFSTPEPSSRVDHSQGSPSSPTDPQSETQFKDPRPSTTKLGSSMAPTLKRLATFPGMTPSRKDKNFQNADVNTHTPPSPDRGEVAGMAAPSQGGSKAAKVLRKMKSFGPKKKAQVSLEQPEASLKQPKASLERRIDEGWNQYFNVPPKPAETTNDGNTPETAPLQQIEPNPAPEPPEAAGVSRLTASELQFESKLQAELDKYKELSQTVPEPRRRDLGLSSTELNKELEAAGNYTEKKLQVVRQVNELLTKEIRIEMLVRELRAELKNFTALSQSVPKPRQRDLGLSSTELSKELDAAGNDTEKKLQVVRQVNESLTGEIQNEMQRRELQAELQAELHRCRELAQTAHKPGKTDLNPSLTELRENLAAAQARNDTNEMLRVVRQANKSLAKEIQHEVTELASKCAALMSELSRSKIHVPIEVTAIGRGFSRAASEVDQLQILKQVYADLSQIKSAGANSESA